MSKVVWHVLASLDGFIAGPDDAMDWIFAFRGESPTRDEVIPTTGAILTGRRMHDKTPKPRRRPIQLERIASAESGQLTELRLRPTNIRRNP